MRAVFRIVATNSSRVVGEADLERYPDRIRLVQRRMGFSEYLDH